MPWPQSPLDYTGKGEEPERARQVAQKAAPREEEIKQVGAAAKKSSGQENRMIMTQATEQWLLCHHNMRDKEQDKDPNSKCQVPGLSQGPVRLALVMAFCFNVFCLFSETGFHYYSPGWLRTCEPSDSVLIAKMTSLW